MAALPPHDRSLRIQSGAVAASCRVFRTPPGVQFRREWTWTGQRAQPDLAADPFGNSRRGQSRGGRMMRPSPGKPAP